MQRIFAFLEYQKTLIHYSEYGISEKVLICFHGYGQSNEYFKQLEDALKDEYKIYSFDLFYHGKSFWHNDDKPLTKEYWGELFAKFLEEKNIEKFSLLGYSMGGKFALATLEIYSNQVDKLILIAPDGIKTSIWYRLATSSKFMRGIFKSLIENPGIYEKLVKFLYTFGVVDKGILRFADTQMQTRDQRSRVYYSWVNFRELKFKMSNLSSLVNRNNIKCEIFFGEYDKLIAYKDTRKLLNKLKNKQIHILKSGHTTLVDAVVKYYKNKLS